MGQLMRLAFVLLAVFIPFCDATSQTAAEIVALIESRSGVEVSEGTVDTFKAGNPQQRITGVAVTTMATLDVLQRAVAAGHNLIITHEPTFYSHRDATDALEKEGDEVYRAKQRLIADKGLVVWRFHDRPHAMKPDMIRAGMVRQLGWEKYQSAAAGTVFDLPASSIGSIARTLRATLDAGTIRIVGDTASRVSRVGLTQGFPGFGANRTVIQHEGVEALVMGEDHEWETIEYAVDAVTAGRLKGVIVVGHIASEQGGMLEVSRWLKSFITHVPVEFLPTREAFVRIK